jgi:hypothetical protein
VEPPPVDPPATDPPPVDPPPTDPPVEPPPVEPPPVEPPRAEPPPVDPPPAQSPPAGPPAGGQPATGVPAGSAPASPDAEQGGAHSGAQNVSRTIQVVVQVQRGCRSHCHGTSQTQRSVQLSDTIQSATAVSGGSAGSGSTAEARNESSTIQFVWQTQIGCVAFCYHTSQSQEASQEAHTIQEADAQSALMAWADNLAESVQYVIQTQRGCEHECFGVSQYQSISQSQTTQQWANATVSGDEDVGDGSFLIPDWLVAYALNIGATIQTIYQYQDTLCLEYCMGDVQLQEALQEARTDQRASAYAGPPPPDDPPAGEEPPVVQPPPGPTGPSAGPQAGVNAAPSAAAPSSHVRSAFVPGEQRRRTVRRQELELRAVAQATGGAPAAPAAPIAPAAPAASAPVARSPVASGSATVGTDAPAAARTTSDNSSDTRSAGDQLPAQTFAVPSTSNPGGSMSWLVILLLAAALASAIGAVREDLHHV